MPINENRMEAGLKSCLQGPSTMNPRTGGEEQQSRPIALKTDLSQDIEPLSRR